MLSRRNALKAIVAVAAGGSMAPRPIFDVAAQEAPSRQAVPYAPIVVGLVRGDEVIARQELRNARVVRIPEGVAIVGDPVMAFPHMTGRVDGAFVTTLIADGLPLTFACKTGEGWPLDPDHGTVFIEPEDGQWARIVVG